jgi:hypothetical protein
MYVKQMEFILFLVQRNNKETTNNNTIKKGKEGKKQYKMF